VKENITNVYDYGVGISDVCFAIPFFCLVHLFTIPENVMGIIFSDFMILMNFWNSLWFTGTQKRGPVFAYFRHHLSKSSQPHTSRVYRISQSKLINVANKTNGEHYKALQKNYMPNARETTHVAIVVSPPKWAIGCVIATQRCLYYIAVEIVKAFNHSKEST
jgi:hypothetical protein